MPLSSERHPDFRFDGDYVHFKMEDYNGAVVHCAVTTSYLVGHATQSGVVGQGCRALFTMFRADIEAVASEKFANGSDRPLVTANDLPILRAPVTTVDLKDVKATEVSGFS